MHDANPHVVDTLRRKILDCSTPIAAKWRALFALRNITGTSAETAMSDALADQSALFRHEVAYCLGQRQEATALPCLRATLSDPFEHPMVRHEAGEALGAIGTPECLQLLEQYQADPCLEVAQTCQLALQRIQYYDGLRSAQDMSVGAHDSSSAGEENTCLWILRLQPLLACPLCSAQAMSAGLHDISSTSEESASPYLSVDPAPATPASTPTAQLRSTLLDEHAPIFERYRALFGLRNKGGAEAIRALDDCMKSESALLKHEVAYVLGQMQDSGALDCLERVLRDERENAMVRHEAAEALGSIADRRCVSLLETFSQDAEPIVAESCVVALDMLEYEESGELQYVDSGIVPQTAVAAC